jgi:hypothetical protein
MFNRLTLECGFGILVGVEVNNMVGLPMLLNLRYVRFIFIGEDVTNSSFILKIMNKKSCARLLLYVWGARLGRRGRRRLLRCSVAIPRFDGCGFFPGWNIDICALGLRRCRLDLARDSRHGRWCRACRTSWSLILLIWRVIGQLLAMIYLLT